MEIFPDFQAVVHDTENMDLNADGPYTQPVFVGYVDVSQEQDAPWVMAGGNAGNAAAQLG